MFKRFFSDGRIALRLSFLGFTDRAINAVSRARSLTSERHHREVTPEHILLAALADLNGFARNSLKRLGLNSSEHEQEFVSLLDRLPADSRSSRPSLGPATECVLDQSRNQARTMGQKYVGTEHLILGLIATPGPAGEYSRGHGVTLERYAGLM